MRTLVFCLALFTSGVVYASPCAVPNAIPNDGLDDRAAIQVALDTQGCAELEIGTYDVKMIMPRPAGAAGWGQLFFSNGDILRGKGPGTKIKFSGGTLSGDWYGLWVRKASDVLITDVYLDTTDLRHSNEQTHIIQISGPAERVTVDRVWFNHPMRNDLNGNPARNGDCIKMLGSDLAPVSAKVESSWFVECDRSGIASTGGIRSLVINNNTFFNTGDQDVDFEASQQSSSLTVTNNHTLTGSNAQGAWSMAIGTAHDVVFSGNVLTGRGLQLYNVESAMITDSIISRNFKENGEPVIELLKAVHRITISNVQASRDIVTPGAVIHFGHHTSGYPTTIRIQNSSLFSFSDGPLIAGAAKDIQIINSRLERTKDAPWTCDTTVCESWAVDLVGGIVKTDMISVGGNVFVGKWDYAVRISGIRLGIGAVSLYGNQAPGVPHGLYCPSPAGISGPIMSGHNTWGGPLCGMSLTPGN